VYNRPALRHRDSKHSVSRFAAPRRATLLAFVLIFSSTAAGCVAEAHSETEVVNAEPVLASLPQVPSGPTDGDAPGATAVAVAERNDRVDATAEPKVDPAPPRPTRSAPTPAPHRDHPVLVATDTDGGQIVDFEASRPEPIDVLRVEAGAELVFTVETELSTKDNRAGDVFYAYLTDDLVAPDGMVLLPRGVRARGRVIEAFASEDSNELPVLDVVLEELLGPDGDMPIDAIVLEIPLEGEARDSGRESAVKVLTGAAAGAILGRILGGDDDDAVKGGVVGAAAGAAVAYRSRGGHAKLPAGAHITIRLERSIVAF